MSARHAAGMLVLAVGLAIAVAQAGCETSLNLKNPLPRKSPQEAQEAAVQAAAQYPAEATAAPGAAMHDSVLVVLLDRDAKTIRLVNPSEQSFLGVRIWLDGTYATWLNQLPARRVVVLPQDAFFDANKKPYVFDVGEPRRVEVEMGGEVYRVLGPAIEYSRRDGPNRGLQFAWPPPR
jgi:hypothetical protein